MSYQQPCLIREAVPDDIEALIQLCAEHAAYEGARYNPQGKGEQLSSALFSTPPRLYAWVIEQDGKLLGYATATQEFSTWDAASFLHMDCLYLRENTRGRGLGPLLVKEIAHLALKLGCVNVQWQTPIWNERAISFYQRLGAEGRPKMRFSLPGHT
ncbi:GCN5 family N-acetyltransferase [Ktedonobacter sp. SOSP1-85]|uniref:GNAT family N-acetyltransferase n=1 Tax=Ktedonobacter sp. SOSP1-85 TaxID=2778367 RepID=UPI001916C5F8|nr:GNAT family N-acetyltransferase [Ktedonobacter sp. SOSP1-85]GHO81602.1 GCN5 family N-acetyltransferase [Ktedonobacter sp. SOSP1-85]